MTKDASREDFNVVSGMTFPVSMLSDMSLITFRRGVSVEYNWL